MCPLSSILSVEVHRTPTTGVCGCPRKYVDGRLWRVPCNRNSRCTGFVANVTVEGEARIIQIEFEADNNVEWIT